MSDNLKLKQLEKKAYTAYHQDGVLDIIIGLCLLGFGVRMATDSPAFLIMSWLPILFYLPLKNRITIPRFGYVRFNSERGITVKFSLAIAVGLVFVVFILGLIVFAGSQVLPTSIKGWLKEYHMLLLGGFAAIAFAGAGFFTGINRFYSYAVLIIIIILTGIWLGLPAPIYVIGIGILILMVGLVLVYRFMQKYPIYGEG